MWDDEISPGRKDRFGQVWGRLFESQRISAEAGEEVL